MKQGLFSSERNAVDATSSLLNNNTFNMAPPSRTTSTPQQQQWLSDIGAALNDTRAAQADVAFALDNDDDMGLFYDLSLFVLLLFGC